MQNTENQDALFYEETENFLFYAVADGVSTCKNSRKGAEVTCKAVCDILLNEFDYFFNSNSKKVSWLILNYIKKQLNILANQSNQSFNSYASTLCFVCIKKGNNTAITFTLGDSHLYILDSKKLFLEDGIIDYEDNIVCATVTENAEKNAVVNFYENFNYDGIIICSDGAWKTLFGNKKYNIGKELYVNNPKKLIDQLKSKKIDDDATLLYVA